jgi:hypothetical protein
MPVRFFLVELYIFLIIVKEIRFKLVAWYKGTSYGLLFNGELVFFVSSKASACLL